MRASLHLIAAAWLVMGGGAALAQQAAPAGPASSDDQYIPGPEWQSQADVPRGKTFEFTLDHSKIFPGTTRKITVYVPAQYSGDKPACVYVGLDAIVTHLSGVDMEIAKVFDNLIDKHEMPVTIAIGVSAGSVASANTPPDPRFNRSYEFDGLNDQLARFLLEEVFPEIERHKSPDGLPILLSSDPNDRAVGGMSTGAIGAFTLAWERPDAFRRVFTAIGTFVGMRGGDRYAVLVRKTEPKPLRIFMQDGSNDEWMGGPEVGDWWMSNQTMERALVFAGYTVQHAWGEGTHNARHPLVVFPDAMRWLWKDWPQPVTAGASQNTFLKDILQPGEPWQPVSASDPIVRDLAAAKRTHQVVGPQGRVYGTDSALGQIWLSTRGAKKIVLDEGLQAPTGIAISPDGLWLAVAESKTHWGYSYRVEADGRVHDKQRFYWFHVPDDADDSGTGAWVTDKEGRLYAATRMGVQVFDHNGRVRAILPVPTGAVTGLSFGGENLDVLYVTDANGRAYRRRFKVPGLSPGAAPIAVPNWGAG
jgi:gluconolactonase